MNTSITVGGSAVTVSLSSSGDKGYVAFSGTGGASLGLGVTASTFAHSVSVKVTDPGGATVASTSLISGAVDLNIPPLGSTGTYTIVLDPGLSNTGSATLTLSDDLTDSITAGGAAVSATLSRYGQNERISFSGTAGEQMGLGLTAETSGLSNWTVRMTNPDGTTLFPGTQGGLGASPWELDFTLPSTGTYTITVDPNRTSSGGLISTGSVTLTLSDDLTGSITAGGSAVTASISRYGQNERVTFTGSAGEHLGLGLTAVTGGMTNWSVDVRKPDDTSLFVGQGGLGTTGWDLDFMLPVAGTYTIFIDPNGTSSGGIISTGSATLTLTDDSTDTITVGGATTVASISRYGQNERVTFSGSVGEQMGLGLTGSTIASWAASVLKPDGTTLVSQGGLGTAASDLDFTLPTTGTYSVFIDPGYTTGSVISTGSVTLTLSDDIVASINADGGPVTATISRVGQNESLALNGAGGQLLAAQLSNPTFGGVNSFVALNPDGSTATSTNFFSASLLVDWTVGADGTSHIRINPRTNTGSVTLAVRPYGDAPISGALFAACASSPVFRAEPVNGATGYQFQIATDSAFSSVVADSGTLPSTNTYTPVAGALGNGSYYWRWKTATGNWSSGKSFTVSQPTVGTSSSWPIWGGGPLQVNEADGNLIAAVPGPSFPSPAGALGVSLSYNSLEASDAGLGAGWILDAGAGSAPVELIDFNLFPGAGRADAVIAVAPDDSASCFTQVGQTNTFVNAPGDGQQLTRNADGSYTLVSGDSTASYGAADGTTAIARLSSVESTSGSTGTAKLSYTFSSADPSKLTAVSDDTGRSVSFVWKALNPSGCTGAIVCITGPDNQTWKLIGATGSGTTGNLLKVNDGTRDLAAVGYDTSGRLNTLQNANDLDPTHASTGYNGSHTVTVGYDASGRVASVSSGPITGQTPSTSTVSFDYHPGSVSTAATRAAHGSVAAGTVRTAAGYTLVTPPSQQGLGSPKTFKVFYDGHGNMLETDDVFGNVSEQGYNSGDEHAWSEDADGNPTDYTWDTLNDVPTSITGPDPDGSGSLTRPVTSYRYDETQIGSSSNAGAAIEGLQGAYFTNANLAGRPALQETDATVDFNWGSSGPTGLGASDHFSARWTGNLNITSAGQYTFSTVSDEGTRLVIDGTVAIDNWLDQTVTTKNSQPITLTAGLHKIVLEYFDDSGPAEAHLEWACTGCSPAISTQVIPSSSLQPAWLDQTSVVSPTGRIAFSHSANPWTGLADYSEAKLADGTALITSYGYDDYGRMTSETMPKGNAARTIDADGNLTGTADSSYTTTWSYYGSTATASPPAACGGSAVNQAGQLETKSVPGVHDITYVYDAAGDLVASTNGAGTACPSYDSERRLASETAPGDAAATTYSYDPAGNPLSITNAAGTDHFVYDEADRLADTTDTFGAEASYAYDADGNLTLRKAYNGPLTASNHYDTSYSYDEADRLTSLTDPASRSYSLHYDSRSNLHAIQYPNGTFGWLDINPAGWLTARYNRHGTLTAPLPASVPADSSSSPLSDYAYTYNDDGQETSEQRSGGGLTTTTTDYGYDNLGRLATVSGAVFTTPGRYCYDLDSNRSETYSSSTASCGDSGPTATYSYSTTALDRLTSDGTSSYGYTSDGQVNQIATNTLSWDGWGRNTGGTYGSTNLTYTYGPADELAKRTTNSPTATNRYLLGDLFETDGTGTITTSYMTGNGIDLAHYQGPPTTASTVTYQYQDGHGNTTAEADNTGTRTNNYSYDPFGIERPGDTLPANTTTTRYTGGFDKQTDTLSDLILMGARPYDPALGRFLATDPIDGGSLNQYDYAGQDPINGYDLDGLRASDCAEHPECAANLNAAGVEAQVKAEAAAGRASARTAAQAARPAVQARISQAGLPTKGVSYTPDSAYQPGNRLPGNAQRGYIDAYGNRWVKGEAHGLAHANGDPFEWDVQLGTSWSKQLGTNRLNVTRDGRISH